MFSDLSGFESECRFQNAVDSLPCQLASVILPSVMNIGCAVTVELRNY